MSKNIFDYKHVKQVSCYSLQDKTTKDITGKIIANWSDNPNGAVCTAQVILWNSNNYNLTQCSGEPIAIGKAGGYGYDKLSAAIDAAMHKGFKDYTGNAAGRGESSIIEYFDSIGIICTRIC